MMKPKVISQIVIDSLMTILLIAQMGLHFWADIAHEWVGAGMFVLFIAHHVLNLHWYKTMFKSKYTPYRMVRLTIDILVLVDMIGLMVSGMMLSQYVFVFSPLSGSKSFARILHMLAAYWGFVLMALHLGLHWNIFIGMFRKSVKPIKLSPLQNTLLGIAGTAIAAYGFYVFIHRELLNYMLLQTLFAFHDYEEAKILFYLDYLAMMASSVWIARNFTKLLSQRSSQKKR